MRANRLLSILIILQLRGRVTAQSLANEFEVSVRTVYRDIDELSAAGVPVYADRGPGGGFKLLDGYRTRLTGMTAGEAEALMLVGLPGAAADLGLAEPLAIARLKLLAAVPVAAAGGAVRIGERFHLDTVDWYRRATPPIHLVELARAVWSERRVSMRYESWSATVQRTVDPLGVVLKAGAWYLLARVNRDIRTYKVAKVTELTALDDSFDYPAGFDLAAHWQASMRRFEQELRRDKAVLRIAPAALDWIDRLGADTAEAILGTVPDRDGFRQAEVPIESIDHAARSLIGFGDTVTVIGPPDLRQAIADLAATVTGIYAGRAD